jgi:hypothetical protein
LKLPSFAGGCEVAEGARKPEPVKRRVFIRTIDARKHAGCNSRDTIGALSIANVDAITAFRKRPFQGVDS